MRYYIILFFSVLSFLCACNRSGVPDGIIPPDQMAGLLGQVYLVDGRLYALPQFPDTLYKYGTARYLAVFKKFNVDSAQFRKSYLYYSSNAPQKLLDMNTKILAALQIKSDSLTALITKRQLEANANTVPSTALKHAYIAHPEPVGTNSPPTATAHPASAFHPGTNTTTAAPGVHPASTFHPGSGGGPVMQQPATVLSHGRVVPANGPINAMQRFKIKQDIMKRIKAKRDSIKAKHHK